jgi:hypothetical protein
LAAHTSYGEQGLRNRLLALAAVLSVLLSRTIVVITTFMIDKLEINLYPIQQQSDAVETVQTKRNVNVDARKTYSECVSIDEEPSDGTSQTERVTAVLMIMNNARTFRRHFR